MITKIRENRRLTDYEYAPLGIQRIELNLPTISSAAVLHLGMREAQYAGLREMEAGSIFVLVTDVENPPPDVADVLA